MLSSRAVLHALRSRDYRLFWTGSLVSNIGLWMQQIAIGWLVYAMTGKASVLGTVSFFGNAPILLLGLLGGAIADRASRRTIMLGTQLALAALTFVLAALTASGHVAVWHIIAISMASGVANALYTPAMQAVLPTLVDAGDLLNAISLNAVQFNLARAVGPMLTAFTYAVIGPEGCFIVNGVTFLALAVLLARIRIPAGPAVAPPSLAHALGEGLRYARSHVVIGPALRLAAVISVLGFPYIILLPALARDALHLESASGLGYLMACVGMGAVLGGLALSAAGDVPRKGLVAVASSLGFSATLAAFALVHRFAATCVLLFVLGFLQTACVASLNTTIQVAVDDGMRGRIMSIMTVLLFGFSTVGGLLVGALGDRIGVPRAIAAGAAVVFCAGLATLVRTPTLLRRLEAAPVTG